MKTSIYFPKFFIYNISKVKIKKLKSEQGINSKFYNKEILCLI